MKKLAAALGVLVAAGAALLATGPRLEAPDLTLPTIDLPDDLDAFVADAEAQVPGTSMGGALTTWLAAQNPPDLAAIVLISPAFGLHDPDGQAMLARLSRWPWGAQATRLMAGEYRTWEDAVDAVRQYWTTPYRTEALLTLAQLIITVEATDLSVIETPVLIVYSTQDEVVSPTAIETAYEQFGSERKQLVAVESAEDPSHHVIAGEILSPGATETVAAHIMDFVQSLAKASPDSTSYASSSSKR